MHAPVKPPALLRGQTVGIVAPASPPDRLAFAHGVGELERLDFRVRYGEEIFSSESFFAGSHERRRKELESALTDPEVAAVLCARGGYGTNYLLDALAFERLRARPKIFLGYSDVSTLLNCFYQRCGWVTFHGPMVAPDFARGAAGYDLASLEKALMNTSSGWTISSDAEVLRPGSAEGILLGGCLPMLAETLGTPYEIETDGAVLFLEDRDSKPYQIDRMLMHLKLAGKLASVRGVIFGEMVGCQPANDAAEHLQQVVLRVLHDVAGPVVFGLTSGHVSGANLTLPLGLPVRLRAGKRAELEFLEPAVSPATTR